MPKRLPHSGRRSVRAGSRCVAAWAAAGWFAAASVSVSAEDAPQGERPVFQLVQPQVVVPALHILVEEQPAAGAPRQWVIESQERVVVVNGDAQVQRIHVRIELDRAQAQTWRTWIFRTHDLEAARADLERALQQRLAHLQAHAGLTEEQLRKLELAGRGDVSRFLDDCEEALGDLERGDPSPQALQDARDRCLALRSRMLGGLHGEGSLFLKSLQAQLTDEQRLRWEAAEAAQAPPQSIRREDQPRVLIRPNF